MALCLQCNKWINQTEGKRKKQFCNNTCRSNYWYAKNKKGQADEQSEVRDLTKPTNVVTPYQQPETNFSINTMPKPSKLEIEAIKHKYVDERRDCTSREDYLDWLARVENDDRLSRNDRELVKNTH